MVKRTIAKVADAQGSPLAVAIEVSGHHLFGDEPASEGGANLGPTPFDLLTAALAECTAMTVRWFAMRQGWPLEHVSVEVQLGRKLAAGDDAAHDHFRKIVRIEGAALTEVQKQALFDVAGKCPVHKTLIGDIRIETIEAAG